MAVASTPTNGGRREIVCPACCIVINGPERVGYAHEHCGCADPVTAKAYDRLSLDEKVRAARPVHDQGRTR